jgi:hypothetical protein
MASIDTSGVVALLLLKGDLATFPNFDLCHLVYALFITKLMLNGFQPQSIMHYCKSELWGEI